VSFCREVIYALEQKVEYKQQNKQGFNNIEIATL
jgi:hypothetical protein